MTAIERREQCLKCEFEKTKGIGDFRDMYCTYYRGKDEKINDAYFCPIAKNYQIQLSENEN